MTFFISTKIDLFLYLLHGVALNLFLLLDGDVGHQGQGGEPTPREGPEKRQRQIKMLNSQVSA